MHNSTANAHVIFRQGCILFLGHNVTNGRICVKHLELTFKLVIIRVLEGGVSGTKVLPLTLVFVHPEDKITLTLMQARTLGYIVGVCVGV